MNTDNFDKHCFDNEIEIEIEMTIVVADDYRLKNTDRID